MTAPKTTAAERAAFEAGFEACREMAARKFDADPADRHHLAGSIVGILRALTPPAPSSTVACRACMDSKQVIDHDQSSVAVMVRVPCSSCCPPAPSETEQQRLARQDSDRHATIDAEVAASLEQGRRDAERVREATTHGGNQGRFRSAPSETAARKPQLFAKMADVAATVLIVPSEPARVATERAATSPVDSRGRLDPHPYDSKRRCCIYDADSPIHACGTGRTQGGGAK